MTDDIAGNELGLRYYVAKIRAGGYDLVTGPRGTAEEARVDAVDIAAAPGATYVVLAEQNVFIARCGAPFRVEGRTEEHGRRIVPASAEEE